MKTVYLYSTLGCHLCEQAKELLWPLLTELDLRLEEKDIAHEDALVEAYGVRIPVLLFDPSQGDLGWPFDQHQARDYLLAALASEARVEQV